MRKLVGLATATLAVVYPAVVRASPLIEQFGSVGDNAGRQGVVSGPGAASVYFNPAALTEAEDSFLVAFAFISQQIGVTLDGRNGGDVPLSVGAHDILGPNGQPLPNDVVPTQWLQNGCPAGTTPGTCPPPGFAARPRQSQGNGSQTFEYLTLGLVKQLIKNRFTLGLYAMLPVSSFTTAQSFYVDEREALFTNSLHPELYGDRLTSVSIVAGAGVKILPSLSVGLGLSIGLANVAASDSYIQDSTNYSTLLLNNAVQTKVNFSPTVGVHYRPTRSLRFGFAVHAPESFDITTNISATLPTGTTLGSPQDNVFDWMPWSFNLGAEADVVRGPKYKMSVTGSVNYALWSAYRDRHDMSPADYGSELAWSDTLSVALGVRHHYKNARGFMDLTYFPSPVPEQIGNSNYVDNDKVGLLLGGDVDLKLGPLHIRPGVQLGGDRLIYRHNTKDDSLITNQLPEGSVFESTHDPVPGTAGLHTNNPGWPGFASAGWIWSGAVTLKVPL